MVVFFPPICFFQNIFFSKNKRIVLLVINNLANSKLFNKRRVLESFQLCINKVSIIKKTAQFSVYLYEVKKVKTFQGETDVV